MSNDNYTKIIITDREPSKPMGEAMPVRQPPPILKPERDEIPTKQNEPKPQKKDQ